MTLNVPTIIKKNIIVNAKNNKPKQSLSVIVQIINKQRHTVNIIIIPISVLIIIFLYFKHLEQV